MRYFRTLIVLALIGAVALTTTLASQNGRAAPKPGPVAAPKSGAVAAPKPGPVAAPKRLPVAPPTPLRAATVSQPSLNGVLKQVVGQFLTTRSPRRPSVVVPLHQPGGETCFVAGGSCSLTPCVVPVHSTSGVAVPAPAAAEAVVARQPGRITFPSAGTITSPPPTTGPSGCPSGSLTPPAPRAVPAAMAPPVAAP